MAGRPPFKPTTAQRRQVSIVAAARMPHDKIAAALGITRPTLLKHFDDELTTTATRRRMEVLQAMFVAARKGNVAAMKAFLALQQDEPELPAPHPALVEPKPAGLKEQRDADARTAAVGTEWENLLPRSAPLQ